VVVLTVVVFMAEAGSVPAVSAELAFAAGVISGVALRDGMAMVGTVTAGMVTAGTATVGMATEILRSAFTDIRISAGDIPTGIPRMGITHIHRLMDTVFRPAHTIPTGLIMFTRVSRRRPITANNGILGSRANPNAGLGRNITHLNA